MNTDKIAFAAPPLDVSRNCNRRNHEADARCYILIRVDPWFEFFLSLVSESWHGGLREFHTPCP
jgi:hypothetical protein